jgi:hypothetical protein
MQLAPCPLYPDSVIGEFKEWLKARNIRFVAVETSVDRKWRAAGDAHFTAITSRNCA